MGKPVKWTAEDVSCVVAHVRKQKETRYGGSLPMKTLLKEAQTACIHPSKHLSDIAFIGVAKMPVPLALALKAAGLVKGGSKIRTDVQPVEKPEPILLKNPLTEEVERLQRLLVQGNSEFTSLSQKYTVILEENVLLRNQVDSMKPLLEAVQDPLAVMVSDLFRQMQSGMARMIEEAVAKQLAKPEVITTNYVAAVPIQAGQVVETVAQPISEVPVKRIPERPKP